MEGLVKVKYIQSSKEKEIYYYDVANGDRKWMYRHRFTENGKRKEKSKSGFSSEKAALRSLLEVKAAYLNGHSSVYERENVTVSEWLDHWYESNKHNWKISTKVQRETMLRKHYKPLLGHYKLQKLDKLTYQRVFIQELKKKYKNTTIRTLHGIFKIAINAAVEEDILHKNKFNKVAIDNPNEIQDLTLQYYTPEQLERFLAFAEKTQNKTPYTLLKLLAFSGIRKGEALGLEWSRVNFENNTLTIARTRDDHGVRPPKTKSSYRIITMDVEVMNELKSYRTWCKVTMLEHGIKWTEKSLVFISSRGATPYASTAVTYAMRKVIEKSGLPAIKVHGLRHTHATLLMLNPSISVQAISERLGNSADMINRVYGHVLEKSKYETMLAFTDVLNQQKEVTREKAERA